MIRLVVLFRVWMRKMLLSTEFISVDSIPLTPYSYCTSCHIITPVAGEARFLLHLKFSLTQSQSQQLTCFQKLIARALIHMEDISQKIKLLGLTINTGNFCLGAESCI